MNLHVERSVDKRLRWSKEDRHILAQQRQVKESDVRLQSHPDHGPHGAPQARRAIQLGLCGEALRAFCDDWTISIENVTEFVHQQWKVLNEEGIVALFTPREEIYPVDDPSFRGRLGMEPHS